MLRMACIVEGHGEVEAAPILIHRIARSLTPPRQVVVHPVLRIPAARLVREGELERAVELAARKTGGLAAVLVLLDCEDQCPAQAGPPLLQRARRARPDIPVGLVLAHPEFETWFVAAAESLRGKRGLPANLTPPERPEHIRGAKEWLRNQMPPGRRYKETLDQPELTRYFDLQAARKTNSFDKCVRETTCLLGRLQCLGKSPRSSPDEPPPSTRAASG
jgi:hypothetical protein